MPRVADRAFSTSVAVDQQGRVDYAALDRDVLQENMHVVGETSIAGMDYEHRYAFLVNSYNIAAVWLAKRILWRPNDAPRRLANPLRWIHFFLFARFLVAGRRTSLLGLEFRLLRPYLRKDPRGHFALVCASAGCPPLKGAYYDGDHLDEDFDVAARTFLRPGAGYRLDKPAGRLWVSRIFLWYRPQFRRMGGAREIVAKYAPQDDAEWIRTHQPQVRYLRYDWSLNMQRKAETLS